MSLFRGAISGGGDSKMARNNMTTRAPKRRIEKVWCTIAAGVTNSIQTDILHAVEDSKTLVRMRGKFTYNIDANCGYGVSIAVAPGTTAITGNNPAVSEDLDNDSSQTELLRDFVVNATASDYITEWEFDSKAMRKLQTGDQILLKYLGDTNPSGTIGGVITMWFKE